MMRSFGAADLVRLPVLSVNDAITLGTALLTWAEAAGPLPDQLRVPLERLREVLDGLSEVARHRVEKATVNSAQARQADRVLDAAWSAAYSWCTGWSKLPSDCEPAQKGQKLRDALFADGLKFTQLRYSAQWVESQARLDLIDEHGLDRLFDELGGQAILAHIRESHARYGEVLGLTRTRVEQSVPARERLDAFRAELRRYVIHLAAYVDPADEATQERVDHLLAPLTSWKRSGPGEPAGEPAEPAVESSAPAGEPGEPAAEPAEPAAQPAEPTAQAAGPATERAGPAARAAEPATERAGPGPGREPEPRVMAAGATATAAADPPAA